MPRDTVVEAELRSATRFNEQFWLLPYENPLERRMGPEFFREVPKSPGVYLIRGASGLLLYIGKAKDLRVRLQSYKRANPDRVSRKVIRMIHLARSIEWEVCESERDALLRENRLLREHRPPFNVVNVSPESYAFVALAREDRRLTLRMAWDEEPRGDSERVYGAFKGGGTTRRGYAALTRLLWACHRELEQLGFPARLTRRRPIPLFELELAGDAAEARKWDSMIARFLNGTSRALLTLLTETLLSREGIPPFVYRSIQEDLEDLEDFYLFGPHRNQRIRRHHKIRTGTLIPQHRLDDLLTVFWHERDG